MSTTATQPSLSDENITVERVLDDAIELRIQHGPDQCTGTLNKSDVVALARALNVTPRDLTHSDNAESHPENATALFGVGVMLCMMLSMILYAVRG